MTNVVQLQVEWRYRWTGGFCPLGALNGLPVRGADYTAHPAMERLLRLPDDADIELGTTEQTARRAWSDLLGGRPILLLRNPDQARKLLLEAAEITRGEPVGVPANGSHNLVEAIKRSRALPRFLDLDIDLHLIAPSEPLRFIWMQPPGGLFTPCPVAARQQFGESLIFIDHSDTLPGFGACDQQAAAIVFGLHLTENSAECGAVILFGDTRLYDRAARLLQSRDWPDAGRALAQADRLPKLAHQQMERLAQIWHGLHEAAALPMLPLHEVALAQGVAIRIPPEADTATFLTYTRQENTPVIWLPEIAPLHYAAPRPGGAPDYLGSAAHIARWLLIPVGPGYTEEEIKHAVLGPVKSAEYLGVRWYTDPAYAAEYAALMTRIYGSGHDAYVPVFATQEAVL